ncbi:lipid droplet-associated hydrolase [Diplogelasinospora grovesii]|uniref:Lipid droplet-associated hydrolase n=1 Tax=Diplogelasinospora grovesii TaxID=303347 RepID=A0AAN6N1U0_9PEZI|nr:lipid droplet-associated hydrolase [Diplogelasinospora grovesii]
MASGTRSASLAADGLKVPSLSFPSPHGEENARKQCLVFFIPGNPGLADYYTPFLATLRQLLDETEKRTATHAFHLYGQNLIGFEDADHEPFGGEVVPFGLESQICHFYDRLKSMRIQQDGNPRKGTHFDEVIVMGHSVGAYITIEIFHRHHLQLQQRDAKAAELKLKSAILLFPAVSHLAKSPSGQRLNMVRTTPFLDRNAHHIAKRFVDLWPESALNLFIRKALGFSPHAAAVTTRFLRSRDGIWQAIHLGKDELGTITEERWSEELWEVAEDLKEEEEEAEAQGDRNTARSVPKFFFYFGEDDHWVANECRDEFIEKRTAHNNRGSGRTRIVMDEDGIPHAFCINHSEVVAEKVKVWIDKIAGQ